MSDVTMADCYVIGGNLQPPRPMTPADLDSLIRERGVTEGMVERAGWAYVRNYELVYGGRPTLSEVAMEAALLAALSGTEEE